MSLYCDGCRENIQGKEVYYEVREHSKQGVRRHFVFHKKCLNKKAIKIIKKGKSIQL